MSEPALSGESLWSRAPAWRNLAVAATLLTAAAAALPLVLPPTPPVHGDTAIAPQISGPQRLPSPLPPPALPGPAETSTAIPRPPAHPTRKLAQRTLQPADRCAIQVPDTPGPYGVATVLALEDHATSLARLRQTEQARGGPIDPAYIDNQRIIVRDPIGRIGRFTLPAGMHVAIGDRVSLQSAYRNRALACNYVPYLVTADLGPTPANSAIPDAAVATAPAQRSINE